MMATFYGNSPWPYWCRTTTSSAATTIDTITVSSDTSITWTSWCYADTAITGYPVYNSPAPPTQEQVDALNRIAAENRQRAVEAEARAKAANERAEALLIENLSLRQRAEYQVDKSFTVQRKDGRRYRIRRGVTNNIDMIGRDGKVSGNLCAHLSIDAPTYDHMLAQKLHLEDDDTDFIRRGNRRSGGGAQVLPALH